MYVHIAPTGSPGDIALADIARIQAFKGRRAIETWRRDGITIAGFGRMREGTCFLAEVPGQVWAISAGCWVHRLGIRSDDLPALLTRYLLVGADVLATELDGVFALILGDHRRASVTVFTDPCGSLHLYRRDDPGGIAFSTSSAGLSAEGQLDPIAIHEFVASGIVYENRSIWRGITKLPPGSVIEIDVHSRKMERRCHWDIGRINAESLGLPDAVEILYSSMTESLRAIGNSFGSVAADLTGGYDSRMLLAGLLSSGIEFQSTVSGPTESPDVRIAQGLAHKLGRNVLHSAPFPGVSPEQLQLAVRLSDGECDAFDTARILNTHLPASEHFGISLNGSFGELARGYWWELLWPRLGVITPLDSSMVAHKRFSAIPYDPSALSGAAAFDFKAHMVEVVRRAVSDLTHLPNTSQMDGLYFRLRMQRWQGRIASTTNQIWPAISPLAFRAVLSPMLEARADIRFRSLLPRTMFAVKNRILAEFPLEHGYPPRPIDWTNAPRFWPVITYYGGKVWDRAKARIPAIGATVLPPAVWQRHARVFDGMPLADWLASPMVSQSGLFDTDRLIKMLNPTRNLAGSSLEQWNRLVSLECATRLWGQANCTASLTVRGPEPASSTNRNP